MSGILVAGGVLAVAIGCRPAMAWRSPQEVDSPTVQEPDRPSPVAKPPPFRAPAPPPFRAPAPVPAEPSPPKSRPATLSVPPAPPIPVYRPERCLDQVAQVDQTDGIATVTLGNPCRSGQTVSFFYHRYRFQRNFDNDGMVSFPFALIAAESNLTYRLADGIDRTLTLTDPGFAREFRVILYWNDPVVLDLHIIEPGARRTDLTGHGHIWRENRNVDGKQGIGQLDLVDLPTKSSTGTYSQSYVARDSGTPANRVFGILVDFASRGPIADGDYCQGRGAAEPSYELLVIDHGKVDLPILGQFDAIACGVTLDETTRYRRQACRTLAICR